MISLQDSRIEQILPGYFSGEFPGKANVLALGFALSKAIQRLIAYCGNISVFSMVDTVPDYVLDMLALELDTQYYDTSLDIAVKRKLIKNTMVWYIGAGTPKAVEELVAASFGHGEVKEWFEYGGRPYYFKILTNAPMDQESMNQFSGMIAKVKNARSHLESLEFDREVAQNLYSCGMCITEIKADIGWEG